MKPMYEGEPHYEDNMLRLQSLLAEFAECLDEEPSVIIDAMARLVENRIHYEQLRSTVDCRHNGCGDNCSGSRPLTMTRSS